MKKVLICGGGNTRFAQGIAEKLEEEKDRGINIIDFDSKEVKQRLEIEAMNITELQEYTPPLTRRERRAEERKLKKQKH
uniref:Uncharacterized protein n=1 Tax=uncultured marine virus TaxID=186617 RepID=A0A0F7L7F7_9VIRU|nr:hypothetical protein [uncultured marine virus]